MSVGTLMVCFKCLLFTCWKRKDSHDRVTGIGEGTLSQTGNISSTTLSVPGRGRYRLPTGPHAGCIRDQPEDGRQGGWEPKGEVPPAFHRGT